MKERRQPDDASLKGSCPTWTIARTIVRGVIPRSHGRYTQLKIHHRPPARRQRHGLHADQGKLPHPLPGNAAERAGTGWRHDQVPAAQPGTDHESAATEPGRLVQPGGHHQHPLRGDRCAGDALFGGGRRISPEAGPGAGRARRPARAHGFRRGAVLCASAVQGRIGAAPPGGGIHPVQRARHLRPHHRLCVRRRAFGDRRLADLRHAGDAGPEPQRLHAADRAGLCGVLSHAAGATA